MIGRPAKRYVDCLPKFNNQIKAEAKNNIKVVQCQIWNIGGTLLGENQSDKSKKWRTL